MKFIPLDKNSSVFFKGVAILMIVIHNFMHLFPKPREMEFQFYDDRFQTFLTSLNEPLEILRVLFSYFGHYGVQIFIFISAYGLTKRYESSAIKYLDFIITRFKTIYPSFIIAILIFAIIKANWELGLLGPLKYIYWNFELFLNKILLISNFIPGQEFSLVGPWWFLSFIFQFYLVFPLLLFIQCKFGSRSLIYISVMTIIINVSLNGQIGKVNLYFTVIGHLPEFCLGIYLAKKDKLGFEFPNLLLFISIVVFTLGNIYEFFWHVSHLTALVILLFGYQLLYIKISKISYPYRFFMYLGTISMPLFLVNGFLRKPYSDYAISYDHWFITISLCLASFITSLFFSHILIFIERNLNKGVTYIKGRVFRRKSP